ncbi:MAG TPA: DinB family protein [Thermoanaerobaculia bacterium]|nr:DinB family protein [Thermoanaerobaculia bacterium]
MREALLQELSENFEGRPWHGSPLRRLLDDVDAGNAHAHPIPGARSIAELALHIAAWMEIVERRLGGENPKVTADLDFPPAAGVEWKAILDRVDSAQQRLHASVAKLDGSVFAERAVSGSYSNEYMLRGLMHHNTYHGAQIAMLKKHF